jgi:hypothetical protein
MGNRGYSTFLALVSDGLSSVCSTLRREIPAAQVVEWERELHVTLAWGLVGVFASDAVAIAQNYPPFKFRLGCLTFFRGANVDALAVRVHTCRTIVGLRGHALAMGSGHKDARGYDPHVTVCRVQRGAAGPWQGDARWDGLEASVRRVVFKDYFKRPTIIRLQSGPPEFPDLVA